MAPLARRVGTATAVVARPTAPAVLVDGRGLRARRLLAVDATAVAAEIAGLPLRRLPVVAALLAGPAANVLGDRLAKRDTAQAVLPAGRQRLGPTASAPVAALVKGPAPVGLAEPGPHAGGLSAVAVEEPAGRREGRARRASKVRARAAIAASQALGPFAGRNAPLATARRPAPGARLGPGGPIP